MPTPQDIALALADALPPDASARDELIAVGMVACALISQTDPDSRAELVEHFCSSLRAGVRKEMN